MFTFSCVLNVYQVVLVDCALWIVYILINVHEIFFFWNQLFLYRTYVNSIIMNIINKEFFYLCCWWRVPLFISYSTMNLLLFSMEKFCEVARISLLWIFLTTDQKKGVDKACLTKFIAANQFISRKSWNRVVGLQYIHIYWKL